MSKKFEIPEVLSNERLEDENYNAAYRAAHKHAKQLRKAECDLIVGYDLAFVLKESLDAADDDHALRGATALNEILKRLDKMRDRLSTHATQHTNLFIAYFDLKAEGGAK